jgi:N-acetylmuramoyl-L-alanine amidase
MTRPIAPPAHAPARTRRRQRPFTLLRSALLAALVVTCLFAAPTVIGALRGSGLQLPGPGRVVSQVALSGLESGACMSFAPALGLASKTVFIDPGHGGLDPGVVGESGGQPVLEKDVALAVGTRLAALLQGDGYRVIPSRTKDSSVTSLAASDSVSGALTASAVHRDLLARAACANAGNASTLLSIHFDAFGDPSVGGSETFYDGARSFASDSKRLAYDVQRALVSALGTNDRGIWTDDQLVAPTLTSSGSTYGHLIELGPSEPGYVDDPSKMPGALVEPLFLTNEAEARLANSASGQQRIAAALKDGLEKYLAGS